MKWLLALGFFSVVSLPVFASEKVLYWGGDAAGGAPYILRDPENPSEVVGFEVDVVKKLAEKLGMQAQFVQNQWDNLVPGLKRGVYDIVVNGIEVTEERKKEIDFSDPYFLTHEQLTVRVNDKKAQQIRSLSELKGMKAGTLKASFAEKLLQMQTGVDVLGYDTQTMLYDDLISGRIEAVLLDHPAALYYGKVHEDHLLTLPAEFGKVIYAIGVRKGEKVLLNQVNRALRELIQSGELRHIYERWGIWNSLMAKSFKDHSTVHADSTSYQSFIAYLDKASVHTGWKDKLKQYCGYLPLLTQGAIATLQISILSMILAIIFGLVVALVRLYAPSPFCYLAHAYTEFVRGTPLLIQLFFIYYGLPKIGLNLDPFVAAVIGLSLNYAAYESEVYRTGILAIPHSQMETALSLGMTRWQSLRHIIIPQALRLVVPPITNDFISLLKDSSLVSAITMVELTRIYGQLAATHFDYFGIGFLTASAYFLIGLPFVRLSRYVEMRLAVHRSPSLQTVN